MVTLNGSLVAALVAAGGLSEEAATGVEVRRPARMGHTAQPSVDPERNGTNRA